ncbi:VanZ family protein [Actinoplanes sp. DH11]|uniref:VanZ family protein n=1 Tax=Actinoplanes sp. DH11 TaxID=2857011 RepID=UPI001E658E79|nr:VanZ family protein [Actinoplanes sp. DH11]
MPTHHLTIPALPVLVPLGVVLMVVSGTWLRRRGLLTAGRLGAAWFAGWYAVAVLGATMLPMRLSWGRGAVEGYRLILEPVVSMRPIDFLLNIVMTVPLAALLHIVFGVRDQRRVVWIGFLLSLSIELTQAILVLTLHGNRWADVNDLMSNTIGAYAGFLLFARLRRSERFGRAVERLSFTRSERGTPIAVR